MLHASQGSGCNSLPAAQTSPDPFRTLVRALVWRREWQPTPVSLPREFQGQRSLVGYSPWGCKESEDFSEEVDLGYDLNDKDMTV